MFYSTLCAHTRVFFYTRPSSLPRSSPILFMPLLRSLTSKT